MDTLTKILFMTRFRGYSDGEFTAKAGLYKTVLSEWRAGKTKSYLKHIPAIASALDVSEEFLLDNNAMFSTASLSLDLDDSMLDLIGAISRLNEDNRAFLHKIIDLLLTKQTVDKI